jgi:UDP-glucose 4-epimerase
MNYSGNIKGKKVLITGGLGFIGHNLAKKLIETYNCKVFILDNQFNSNIKTLQKYTTKFTHISDSVNTFDLSILDDFEIVFHLACVQIAHSSKDPFLDLDTNAGSTLRMLEYYRQHQTKLEKFIYTSSASVYGNAQFGICSESGPTRALSHYASTKYLGENYTLMYHKLYGIPTISVRYSNVYGYGQSPANNYCGVLGKFIHNALTGKSLQIFGDGQQTRDYTFTTDAVDATIIAATHPSATGEVFNIGTGIETSVNQIANMLQEKFPEIRIEHVPPRDIDNIRRRYMDINLIQTKLGWEPIVSFDMGLEITIDWYKEFLRDQ